MLTTVSSPNNALAWMVLRILLTSLILYLISAREFETSRSNLIALRFYCKLKTSYTSEFLRWSNQIQNFPSKLMVSWILSNKPSHTLPFADESSYMEQTISTQLSASWKVELIEFPSKQEVTISHHERNFNLVHRNLKFSNDKHFRLLKYSHETKLEC